MLYLICFIISILIFLWLIYQSDKLNINQILLVIITVVSNGGHYSLVTSTTLEKALLANKLIYLPAIFSPMLFFFNICELCRIRLPRWLVAALYTIQLILYLSVLTIGKLSIFYKTVQFNMDENGVYLTKTYGPMHTLYIITMFAYLAAGIGVALYFCNKRNRISQLNIDLIVFSIFAVVCTYFIQRLLHLKIEILPFVFTAGVIVFLALIIKMNRFYVENNAEILAQKFDKSGYIVFSRKLHFMGCNNTAQKLFPELLQWKIEKNIPGNGGRFNTFLRQPLLNYIASDSELPLKGKPFDIKDACYGFTIMNLKNKNKNIGYVIEITDLTDLLTNQNIQEHIPGE